MEKIILRFSEKEILSDFLSREKHSKKVSNFTKLQFLTDKIDQNTNLPNCSERKSESLENLFIIQSEPTDSPPVIKKREGKSHTDVNSKWKSLSFQGAK